ncbi:hypothetical protein Cob_v003335 [Colletotrichum orbiculare MAFF 240422]|uniref:NAD(P)-binding domain-containing protein n=1 Tax=Colletotrichum orbiculare (strain 104-T / ATCC 96160 / CBS 514.97 / LARS 414 / MAFF 240422) TaxID=1213857 RepID=N4VXM0_COLOR|nr:hypothetical protein Cob_v003335 [Colletotrichum orbiculare MAFF 240422]
MPSHITVIPASTQVGKETIRLLLNSDSAPLVRGIYRDLSKAPSDFVAHPHFQAVQGDVGAGTGLDFSTSDAVFYIPPPIFDGSDHAEFAHRAANNVAKALKESHVKRLVLQSSLGSKHDPKKIGILILNYITDEILRDVVPEVVITRPSYYFSFWAQALKAMQTDSPMFESPFSPADFAFPMISTKDIANFSANTLLAESLSPAKREVKLFGPRHYSPLDVKKAIETVTGKPGELKVIPRAQLAEWWAKIVPEAYVPEYVEFMLAQLPGGIMVEDYDETGDFIRFETELVDDLRAALDDGR